MKRQRENTTRVSRKLHVVGKEDHPVLTFTPRPVPEKCYNETQSYTRKRTCLRGSARPLARRRHGRHRGLAKEGQGRRCGVLGSKRLGVTSGLADDGRERTTITLTSVVRTEARVWKGGLMNNQGDVQCRGPRKRADRGHTGRRQKTRRCDDGAAWGRESVASVTRR